MRVEFRVRPDLSSWNEFSPGGLHSTEDRELIAQVAAAHAAGMLVDVHFDSDAEEVRILTVEHDSDSFKKQLDAQFDGSWQEGNQLQFELEHSSPAEEIE